MLLTTDKELRRIQEPIARLASFSSPWFKRCLNSLEV